MSNLITLLSFQFITGRPALLFFTLNDTGLITSNQNQKRRWFPAVTQDQEKKINIGSFKNKANSLKVACMMIGWSTDWLKKWETCWLTDWLTYWLSYITEIWYAFQNFVERNNGRRMNWGQWPWTKSCIAMGESFCHFVCLLTNIVMAGHLEKIRHSG